MRLHRKATFKGITGCLILSGLVLLGSRKLLYFDPALIAYLFSTLFATFGVIYRYSVWRDRPPTKMLWKRSLQLFWSRSILVNLKLLISSFFQHIIQQRFIRKRGRYQWAMHASLSFGTFIAFAITFPLVFGWLHFETDPLHKEWYQLYVFGFPSLVFSPHGMIGFLFFNALNITSFLVMIGIAMACAKRFFHPGLIAVQTFANDFLPLLILFAVASTGLLLTYSTHFLHGEHYRVLSTMHCFTVVMFLVYLPFGKFFHIFQRPAQLGAAFYIREREIGTAALCVTCRRPYTSQLQKEDVKKVLGELGFEYSRGASEPSVQDLCPLCRRRMLMAAQHRLLNGRFAV